MFRKRYRQQIPELNTTSTADISFMLLIFFLVTSSMDTEKGLLRQMAPPPQQEEQLTDINKDNVLQVELDAQNQLTCNGKVMTPKALAEETGIADSLILKWTNHADLFRIKGVGPQFSELLEAAGVDTVKELRNRKPENLAAKVLEINEQKHLVRRVPVLKEIIKMVNQAKELPPMMTY